MKYTLISKTFLIISVFACTEPKLTALQKEEVIKVPLKELLANKAKYHRSLVETEGLLFRMFEWSAIHYPFKGDTIINGEVIRGTGDYNGMLALWDGLWIDEHPRYKVSKQLDQKLVRVRGYFDTTGKGHLGGFSATLRNTYLIQPLN